MSGVCEGGGSGREELNRYPPLSPAVLWIVNVCERKLIKKQNKKTAGYWDVR